MEATRCKAPGHGGGAGAGTADRTNGTRSVTRTRAGTQVGDSRKTAARYIGTVLRESRAMADENLRRGPGPEIAQTAQRARKALDSVVWLCEYSATEAKR